MSHNEGTAYQRLLAAAATVKVPDAVRRVASAVPSDPEAGQIWRAVAAPTVQLILITEVTDSDVTAVPLSMERYADQHTLRMPPSASTLEQPFSLWFGLATQLSWAVLDRQIAELARPGTGSADLRPEDLARFPSAHFGKPAPSPAAPVNEYRAKIADALDALQAAGHWAPQGTGTLAGLIRDSEWAKPRKLAELLHLTAPQVFALQNGTAAVTIQQAQDLGAAIGVPAQTIMDANPPLPEDLVTELSRPLRRWQAQRSETTTQALTDPRIGAAFRIYALAARQSGGTGTRWRALADTYFQAALPETTDQ